MKKKFLNSKFVMILALVILLLGLVYLSKEEKTTLKEVTKEIKLIK